MTKLLIIVLSLFLGAHASLRATPTNQTDLPLKKDSKSTSTDDDEADVAPDDDSSDSAPLVGKVDYQALAADKPQTQNQNKTAQASSPPKFLAFHASPPVADAASNSEITSMEKAMTDLLLGNTAFGATPMGGSVKKIKDILTNDMLPKVKKAHKADQEELNRLIGSIKACSNTKNTLFKASGTETTKYTKSSRLHKSCRKDEAVKFTSKKNCFTAQANLFLIKKQRCQHFATLSEQLGTQKANREVVTKAGGESVESYITRISTTICGVHRHGTKGTSKGPGGWGGGLSGGFLDQYLRAKDACEKATKAYNDKVKECKRKLHEYNVKKGQCDQYQTTMDSSSCMAAIKAKDACETYHGCYEPAVKAYRESEKKVKKNEEDRKAEWRGLHRMSCLIDSFADGKVTGAEVDACKKKTVDTKPMNIKYPTIPKRASCVVPSLYPATGPYKQREFAPLPALAKGKREFFKCTGMQGQPTYTRAHTSAGHRAVCHESQRIRLPCGNCGPRWGNWNICKSMCDNDHNCRYFVYFSDRGCRTYSGCVNTYTQSFGGGRVGSSIYKKASNKKVQPARGSPKSCKCDNVGLAGAFSPGKLVRCTECLDVRSSTQKNSCPKGMKIFSPRSRNDWKTFIRSAKPLLAPSFIIDVTRSTDGYDGGKQFPMNSATTQHATWRTSDRSPWWLRSTAYGQPDGNYKANCYLHLWRTPHNTEDNIQFDDAHRSYCYYHSRSYYCQPTINIDCRVSAWSGWSKCSGSRSTRTRRVLKQQSGTGKRCPALSQTRGCTMPIVWRQLRLNSNGKCLDYHTGNRNVYMHRCHSGSNQKWYLNPITKQIKSQRDGKCLDYHHGNRNAYMHSCHGGSNQKWYFDGSSRLVTYLNRKCLDDSGRNVYLHRCHSGSNQKFYWAR